MNLQGVPCPRRTGLGWLRFGEFPGWWAATVATYCPSRVAEHPKSKSTKPSPRGHGTPCISLIIFRHLNFFEFLLWLLFTLPYLRSFLFESFSFSSAKMGLVGLAKVLAVEGEASGIQCNVIVPMAISRLTQDLIPPGMYTLMVVLWNGVKLGEFEVELSESGCALADHIAWQN